MSYLVDVNVWIALAYSGHRHHEAAVEWFVKEQAPVLFCRTTQSGFLRLLTNRHVMGEPVISPAAAWEIYDAFRRDDRVGFATEPPGLERIWREVSEHSSGGPNFWTDAYLAAFAAARLTVVTFDRGFPQRKNAPVKVLAT